MNRDDVGVFVKVPRELRDRCKQYRIKFGPLVRAALEREIYIKAGVEAEMEKKRKVAPFKRPLRR